jgi:NAD(P)-dependent dehydrogenase (short-subunit alcohol dehydrogenase family)
MKTNVKIAAAGALAGFALVTSRARNRYHFGGRSVVITGGARGLGFALAREFAAEGAHLFLLSRDGDELQRARRALEPVNGSVNVFICDVRDEAAVQHAIAGIVERHGYIDVLVNNAGIIQSMPFEHARNEDFEESLQTHFWGPLHMVHACLPHMRPQSRIVNISSIGGRIAVPHLLPYCAGKAALVALSEGLRAELAKNGVIVTTVTPGLMRTGSHRNVTVRGQHHSEALWFALASSTPLTSMSAERAARQIVEASRRGDAAITPGWQARTATIANALAPGLVAAVMAMAVKMLLPGPVPGLRGDRGRASRDLQLGLFSRFFPTTAAERLNQTPAADEVTRSRAAGTTTAAGLATR